MQCLICGHDTQHFVDPKSLIRYFYCPNCQCISKSSEHFRGMDEQKQQYDLHQNDPFDKGYQAYFQRFLDFVLPLAGKPKKALDFGCGESRLLADILMQKGINSDYYDPIYHPKRPDQDRKYDLIVSTEVFEHLHQPQEVFTELLGLLEEGGYLAIQTQFHPDDIELFKQWYYHLDPTHVVFFTAHTFKILCQISGCELIGENGKNIVVIRKK